MTVWFTADTHLGHANIIKYCQRPFLSAEEQQQAASAPGGRWKVGAATVDQHDQALLGAINAHVGPEDTLWILGDFCWGNLKKARAYREQIQCADVRLVWGNHDHREIEPLFNRCIEQGMIRVKGQRIWLNHYPMRTWDGAYHGSWHLYGHVHGQLDDEDERESWRLTRDVGVDSCQYRPISFDEVRDYMSQRQDAFEENRMRH